MDATGLERNQVFISYSHKDKRWLDELQVHLRPLERDQGIDIWDDTRINVGSKWREDIRGAINRAMVAVLLVSPNFMASDFIAQSELPPLLETAESDGTMVLAVILRSSRFDRDERLNRFQTVNSPTQPLINMAPGKRDVIFEKLAQRIEDLLSHPVAPSRHESIPKSAGQATQPSERRAPRSKDLIPRPRIYISAPVERALNDQRLSIKKEVIRAISLSGFQPQEFGVSGLPANMAWSFTAANEVMRNCQGAFILALARWRVWKEQEGEEILPTEYNHFEGGLATSQGLPSFVMAERGMKERGIVYPGGGQFLVTMPPNADKTWLKSDHFVLPFNAWCSSVKSRSHVFLAYASVMLPTATAIRKYLLSLGVSVLDVADGFGSRGSLKDQVAKDALASCATAIFLFCRDDDLAVRGNLTFELGYFARAKGLERTLVINEAGSELPSEFAKVISSIYLIDRLDITAIQPHLRAFVHMRL